MFYVFYVDIIYFISYARHMQYYYYACVIIFLYIRKYIYTYTYLLQDSSCKINNHNNQFNLLVRRSLPTLLWTPNGSLSLGSYRAEAKGVVIFSAVVPPGPASCSAESSSRLHSVFGFNNKDEKEGILYVSFAYMDDQKNKNISKNKKKRSSQRSTKTSKRATGLGKSST